jgi:hypothetical protein
MPALLATVSTRPKRCMAAYGLLRTCTLGVQILYQNLSPLLGLLLAWQRHVLLRGARPARAACSLAETG